MEIEEEEEMGMAPCLYRHDATSLLAFEEEEEEVAMVGVEEEKTMGTAPHL